MSLVVYILLYLSNEHAQFLLCNSMYIKNLLRTLVADSNVNMKKLPNKCY